jgi:hypothetical protein
VTGGRWSRTNPDYRSRRIGRTLRSPTGEILFNVRARSFLVAGSLREFETANGLNETKVRSFGLYRRSTDAPEILTFDELLTRARFIVEHVS